MSKFEPTGRKSHLPAERHNSSPPPHSILLLQSTVRLMLVQPKPSATWEEHCPAKWGKFIDPLRERKKQEQRSHFDTKENRTQFLLLVEKLPFQVK